MKNRLFIIFSSLMLLSMGSSALAQGWGSVLKSAAKAAGEEALAQMSPMARTAFDESKKLGAGAPQENFLVTKAREFLAAGNYQPALDLANYVITALNSKSVDANKIMADAKAALAKMAQERLLGAGQPAQEAVSDARKLQEGVTQTGSVLQSLWGSEK
jgi:hypothetical protein